MEYFFWDKHTVYRIVKGVVAFVMDSFRDKKFQPSFFKGTE